MTKDKYLIFDFDGTIADSLLDMFQVFNNLSKEYGYKKIDLTDIETYRSKGTREVLKEIEIPVYKLPFVVKRVREELSGRIAKMKPFSGLIKALRELNQKKIRMGILTSNSEENVRQFLKNNKIDFFEFIYAGSSVFGKDKVLRQLLKDKSLTTDEVIYVGDETRDIEAAKKCRVKIISVAWGLSNLKVLADHDPDWIAKKPEDFIKVFKAI